MARRTYEDYKREIVKALTDPEPKTVDYWKSPVKMSTIDRAEFFYTYHRIPVSKTIKILKEISEEA